MLYGPGDYIGMMLIMAAAFLLCLSFA